MIPRFTKGAPLTANDMNALADAACMNIIGGTGVAVTRLGKKLVVNKRLGQKLQRGSIYGNVWKLSADRGLVRWGCDVGGIAYSVCATSSAVYVAGERNNSWGNGGSYASVWRLSQNSGHIVWGIDFGSGIDSFEVHATEDAVFVMYLDGLYKIAKLSPSDGSVVSTVSIADAASNEQRHGFDINSTQLWTWGLVSLAQGVRCYDHDLSLVYSATPPPNNYVDIAWGIGASDDLVGFGAAYSFGGIYTGITNDVLTVTDTTVSPAPVIQFSIAETISSTSLPGPFEIHSNVDVQTNYAVAAYYTIEGSRGGVDLRQSFIRLYDTGGTVLHDLWVHESNTGGIGYNIDVAVDETAGLFYAASTTRIGYLESSLIASGSWHPYRNLIAFDIDTGAIVWKWTPRPDSGGGENLLCVFADRAGSIYTCTYAATVPFMKVGD